MLHRGILLVLLVFSSYEYGQAARFPLTWQWWPWGSSPQNIKPVAKDGLLATPKSQNVLLSGDASQQRAAVREAARAGVSGLDSVATVFADGSSRKLPRLAEDSAADFDLERARLFAQFTSVAYCSDAAVIEAWNCTRCAKVPGFETYEVVFDLQYDVFGYVGYYKPFNAIVLAFRGTDSSNWGNWINNLKAWRQNKMYPIPQAPKAFVHAGFYNLWTASALERNMTAAVEVLLQRHAGARLMVTGHSMGAALANLCAMDMKFRFNFTDVRVWTFGCPRVGNWAWQQLFNTYTNESWRFTHNRDVVPSLPPQLIGFHHVAREVWEVDVDTPAGTIQKVLMCDESGEDPSCHNSACYLGLCTSVADHLMYLGVEMYKDPLEC